MKKLILSIFISTLPAIAFSGIVKGGGSSDCSSNSSYRQNYRIPLGDVAESLGMKPSELFRSDAHFNTGLTKEEQQVVIAGNGKFGSSMVRINVRHRCKSSNGGSNVTIEVPQQFSDATKKKILGFADDKVTDLGVEIGKSPEGIVYNGEAFKIFIILTEATKLDLMENGRFAKNIQVSFRNKMSNAVVEGINKLN